jgi:diguanylate cyclase (GGDEF)-like protein
LVAFRRATALLSIMRVFPSWALQDGRSLDQVEVALGPTRNYGCHVEICPNIAHGLPHMAIAAENEVDANSPQLSWIFKSASAAVLMLSAIVLFAWAIQGMVPHFPLQRIRSIKFDTAALFGLAGVALFVCRRPHPNWRRLVIRLCGMCILLTATISFAEIVAAGNLQGSRWLVFGKLPGASAERMELATAVSFALLGAALILIVSKSTVALRTAQCLLLVPLLLSLVMLIGYFYGSSLVYSSFGHASTTIYTATAFILSSLAILFSRNDLELVAPFRSERLGGLVAKASLPGLIAVPILFGWLLVKAVETEYISFASGTAIYVVVVVALLGRIVWYTSRTLNELDQQRAEARKREDELRTTSTLDPLTKVLNRRGLLDRFQIEWNRSQRAGEALTCVVLDIDYFKFINDNLGHNAGDAVIRAVADSLVQGFRSFDIVARYGGDEFCVILVNAGEECGFQTAERVRQTLSAQPLSIAGHKLHVSLSVGVAECIEADDTFDRLIERADHALLAAKRNGRRQTVAYSQLGEAGPNSSSCPKQTASPVN